MKYHKKWSYTPYRPLFIDMGDIHVCRIAPYESSLTIDWLSIGDYEYNVFIRERDNGEFRLAGSTSALTFTIESLTPDTDYEFFIEADEKKSRIRLARCAEAVGISVINYLHPDDDIYSFSGRYLCSPSIVRHPDGHLLASMDVYAGNAPQNLSFIFRSDDDGKSWHYVADLFPCFWGRLFVENNDVYMLACSTEYGDLLIGKSTDGGMTFDEPRVLMRGGNGKSGEAGVHKNPQPVIHFKNRIWNSLEWGSWKRGYHAPMVMSADENADLLDPNSWSFSYPVKYDPTWKGLPEGTSTGNIEGALVVKEDVLYNIMRYDMMKMAPNFGYVIRYKVNTEDPEAPMSYDKAIPFPANHAKFEIQFCEKTGKYYSIVSRLTSHDFPKARNLLSLMVSDDLEKWDVLCDLIDKSHLDPEYTGFQYVDFIIEGCEIFFACRTAMNRPHVPHAYHDSNYITFHRITL